MKENTNIKENLEVIETRIQKACLRAGRKREDVRLIAVSKTNPVETVKKAMELGINVFGENKVQELCEKFEQIKEPAEWHLIGHLQTNKVKYIVDKVAMIHSVDSVHLAKQINMEAEKKGIVSQILLEVNVAKEDSKYGVLAENLLAAVTDISCLKSVKVRGLMTVAPYTEYAEDNRKYFKQLRDLSVDINGENIDNVYMDVLSMGMTGDFDIAIEEGATHIRVGTGIFGSRNYTI